MAQPVQRQPREKKQADPKDKAPSIFAVTIALLPLKWGVTLVFMIIGSLVVSIIIECICMTFVWPEEGSNHSLKMLEKEVGYLNRDFKDSIFPFSPMEFAVTAAKTAHDYAFVKTGFADYVHKRHEQSEQLAEPNANNSVVDDATVIAEDLAQRFVSSSIEYMKAAMHVTELIAVRVAIALLSIPAFILIGVAATVDGLVERDLRKFGGGIERAMVYHYVKPHAKPIIILAWIVYLSMPISIHPNLIFIPAALLFGVVTFITVSSFKKFL